MHTSIRLERSGETATIVMAAPAGKPPTLDQAVLDELEQALDSLAAQPPRVVVIQSSEPKYFCVGANLHVLQELNADSIVPWVRHGHRVLLRLEELPCPVIAQVSGYAMGGGLELAMACDLIAAGDDAKFAQSEAGLGFIPGWGGTDRLVERVGIATAKRLFFTGQILDAAAAHRAGLVDIMAPAAQLSATVQECADSVLKQSGYALAAFKRIVNGKRRAEREQAATTEAIHSQGCLRDPGTRERIQAFLQRRKG